MIEQIQKNFKNWDRKKPISIGNNKQYKIIGCGPKAFKVLKFEPQEELGNEGGWVQVFWSYNKITSKTIAYKVIKKMESMM